MAIVDWQDAGLHTGLFEHQSPYGVAPSGPICGAHSSTQLIGQRWLVDSSKLRSSTATSLGHKALPLYDVQTSTDAGLHLCFVGRAVQIYLLVFPAASGSALWRLGESSFGRTVL